MTAPISAAGARQEAGTKLEMSSVLDGSGPQSHTPIASPGLTAAALRLFTQGRRTIPWPLALELIPCKTTRTAPSALVAMDITYFDRAGSPARVSHPHCPAAGRGIVNRVLSVMLILQTLIASKASEILARAA